MRGGIRCWYNGSLLTNLQTWFKRSQHSRKLLYVTLDVPRHESDFKVNNVDSWPRIRLPYPFRGQRRGQETS